MAAQVSPSLAPLLLFARISGLLAAALVISWALVFKSSFLPQSTSQEDLIYAVLHPLLMVIGFILISGEAILVHKWLPGSRGFKKSVHLCLQGLALACGIFGIWTKFHGNDGIVANFFSLHSWMGLICISLFGAQWLMGFVSFWHRGEMRTARITVLPWHIFLGLYTYGLAVATAETGLLEKITFLQTKKDVSKHTPESMVVNSLGLSLALLSGIIILAAVSPRDGVVKPPRKIRRPTRLKWTGFYGEGGSIKSGKTTKVFWDIFSERKSLRLVKRQPSDGFGSKRVTAEKMDVPVIRFPTITMMVRVIGVLVAAFVLIWTFHFRGGLALSSDNKSLIFNVHPVLLVIGLVLLNGEAMLAYKTVSGTKSFRKIVHLTMQSMAFCLSIIGVWAAYKFHSEKGVDHFYTLHSWLGLTCLFLFGTQWAAGFYTFWYPGGSINSRAALLPWHVFLGIYIYALAVATTATGILEKATFLQVHNITSPYSTEAYLVNSLGMLVVVLGGCVILAIVTPMSAKGDAFRTQEYHMQYPSV
ncbi:uncharacterized protein [Populus alba]